MLQEFQSSIKTSITCHFVICCDPLMLHRVVSTIVSRVCYKMVKVCDCSVQLEDGHAWPRRCFIMLEEEKTPIPGRNGFNLI